MTTVGEALHRAQEQIGPASDSAGPDAQLLLAKVLEVSRAHVLAYPEQVLTTEQEQTYQQFITRAADGEPLAYLLGRRAFYDRDFVVSPAVLIPRPETELLLEQALAYLRQYPQSVMVDVGTGSGALAVTLAALSQETRVHATDISQEALNIAQINAARHHAKVTFLQGDLLTPMIEAGIRVNLVVGNLPYIASDDLPGLAVSRHEPTLALDGGVDGLTLIRRLIKQIPAVAQPGTCILLEIGANQGEAVLQLVRDLLTVDDAAILPDYAGLDRIMRVTVP